MNKKILWLLLFVPAIFIGASNPFTNTNTVLNDNDTQPCSSYGERHLNWDGNSGCGYVYDFSALATGCELTAIDLDPSTPNTIDTRYEDDHAVLYVTNIPGADGKITMYPKPNYQTGGFLNTCNVNLHFEGEQWEYAQWAAYVDNYAGPYPEPCY